MKNALDRICSELIVEENDQDGIPEPSLYLKCYKSYYLDSKQNICYNIRMQILRKQSNIWGWVVDDFLSSYAQDKDDLAYLLDNTELEHGATYSLSTTNISRDWETGVIDDWDYVLVKIDDKKIIKER